MTKSFMMRLALSVGVAALAGVLFSSKMLGDQETIYMYVFYILVGLFCYCLSKYLGKEIYILVLIPRLLLSANLTYDLFNLHPGGADMQNPFKIHPFTLVWIAIFVCELIEMLYTEDIKLDYIVILGVVMVAVFSALTLVQRGGKGVSLLLENYVGPVTFFLLFYIKRDIDIQRLKRCMNILCACIFLLALFGIIENINRQNPFSSLFLTGEFYTRQTDERYRVLGTVGHIIFPIFMLVACFLVRSAVKKLWIRLPIYTILLFCSMLSQTRSIMVILVIYVLLTEMIPFIKRYKGNMKTLVIGLAAAGTALSTVAVGILLSPVGQRLMARFESDSGSANARIIHLEYFFDNMFSMPLLGIGAFADSIVLLDENNNPVIAEVPWITLYFEVGIFLLLLLAFLFFIIKVGKLKLEMLVLLVAYTPYTTLTGKTQCFFLLYILAIYSIWLKRAETPTPMRVSGHDVVQKPIPPLKQLFPRGQRLLPGICLACAICLMAGFGTWQGVRRVQSLPPTYTASTELYVFVEPHNPLDSFYIADNMGRTVQMHRYIAEDVVLIGSTKEFTAYMKEYFRQETGMVLAQNDYMDRMSISALYTSRIVRISFTDQSPEMAASIANYYARALEQYTKQVMGYRFIQQVTEAEVPLVPVYPRSVAFTVIAAIFTALTFITVFFILDLLTKAYRAYGKPFVVFGNDKQTKHQIE